MGRLVLSGRRRGSGRRGREDAHGLTITSTIHELLPGQRIVWGGTVEGIVGIHAWAFEQNGDRVVVRTEESWSGAPVDAAPEELATALRTSLESWLDRLKARAEQTP
ncbi:hypothetical protein [Streptomyces sp. NPDC098781]|uniref:hypothetical protein n=1 Tax=Streptomyces sp. NPDC098781 TaxID=3366097 RepID=UPI00382A0E54